MSSDSGMLGMGLMIRTLGLLDMAPGPGEHSPIAEVYARTLLGESMPAAWTKLTKRDLP